MTIQPWGQPRWCPQALKRAAGNKTLNESPRSGASCRAVEGSIFSVFRVGAIGLFWVDIEFDGGSPGSAAA